MPASGPVEFGRRGRVSNNWYDRHCWHDYNRRNDWNRRNGWNNSANACRTGRG
jgi:hypothetical protein